MARGALPHHLLDRKEAAWNKAIPEVGVKPPWGYRFIVLLQPSSGVLEVGDMASETTVASIYERDVELGGEYRDIDVGDVSALLVHVDQ